MIDAYNNIPSYWLDVPDLFTYLKNSPRDDYIVTLIINGVYVNELLQYNGDDDDFVWLNDWYEGEKNIQWRSVIPVSDVTTFCPETGDIGYNKKGV